MIVEAMTVENLTPIFNMAREYLEQNRDSPSYKAEQNFYNVMICALLDKPLSEMPE